MAKDSGFNLVEMLNRRSKEQLKGEGEGAEEERKAEGRLWIRSRKARRS